MERCNVNIRCMHDPLLARYHTVDPLFGDYPGQSPWSHCAANPINAIDPTGCAEIFVANDGVMQWVGSNGEDDGLFVLVDKKLAKEISKLTKQNLYYTQPIENSDKMVVFPTFSDFVYAAFSMEYANSLGVETGASKDQSGFIHKWKNGGELSTERDETTETTKHSITPFKMEKGLLPNAHYSQWYFHVHPIVQSFPGLGTSNPSEGDLSFDTNFRKNFNYKGATFVIGGTAEDVNFYYKGRSLGTLSLNNILGRLLIYRINNSLKIQYK